MKFLPLILAPVLAFGPGLLSADDFLPSAQRTNGAQTLQILSPLFHASASSQVALGKSRDATISGTIVGSDGYILTKASEAEQFKPLKIFLEDGSDLDARTVNRDTGLDLLLLKIERSGLKAIQWGQDAALQAGQWLCALTSTPSGRQIRLGVLSASRRPIPNSGVVLGILMGPNEDGDGVLVEEVAEDSPAQLAGLRPDDLVVEVDGKKVSSNKMLNNLINARLAGDIVKLRYLREGTPGECEVRLASRNRVLLNWAGEDFANGGTSVRTDSFPEILQHEIPLQPADMGGALYDLQGNAVGLNIARVDRVTTYALPAAVFRDSLARWIKQDRERALTPHP